MQGGKIGQVFRQIKFYSFGTPSCFWTVIVEYDFCCGVDVDGTGDGERAGRDGPCVDAGNGALFEAW
jgi:hypothetical protein